MLATIVALLIAFHFWFVSHAEDLLEQMVASKSHGNIRLQTGNFKFNWFSRKMELTDAVFFTTDTVNAVTSYRFAVKKIKLKVKELLPMIFRKRILINLLSLQDPDIEVTRLRAVPKDSTSNRKTEDVSIPREMGKIYHSIQDALDVLKVKKFEIENATFRLVNKIDPGQLPVTISRIDFHIDNLKVDSSRLTGKEKIFFSDNIALKSRDQDILFPDGRHRLAYRKFRINIEKKIVEFDSCTIAAIKTDSSAAGFSVYFDALQLTNIDFDTLYRAEVIKADSVYCINPQFKLDVVLDKKKGARRAPPKLDQIIRQLTGDLSLNFVVVNNASFNINSYRNNRVNSFVSSENNFEIQGLQIDQDAKKPLRVKKFAMAIRNYENFLRDSTYKMQFDSVLFNDDKIFLSNFSFVKVLNGKKVYNFQVPRFQLTGLSWDDLLFEQKLRAQQATLYNPVINYTEKSKTAVRKNRTVFDALASISEVMMLEDLNIINGNIDLHLNGGVELQLREATVSVESRSLLGSGDFTEVRRSVNYLDFSKGYFKVNDYTVQLNDIYYTGPDSRMNAGNVMVFNASKKVVATAQKVAFDQIFINEKTGDVNITGVQWQQADVNMTIFPSRQKGKGTSILYLENINGNNTRLKMATGERSISTFVTGISASKFLLKPGERPQITGLALTGKDLLMTDASSRMTINSYLVEDNKPSQFQDIHYTHSGKDTAAIMAPRLSFTPDIMAMINGTIQASGVNIIRPVVSISLAKKDSAAKKELSFPKIRVDKINLQEPEIRFTQQTNTNPVKITWLGNEGGENSLLLLDANSNGSSLSISQLLLSLNRFVYSGAGGKQFDMGQGTVNALLNDISFSETATGESQWQAKVSSLDARNLAMDSLGKNKGRLDIKTVLLRDLNLHSSARSIRQVIQQNTKFRLQQITGSYTDSLNQFRWFNGVYDKGSKSFSLDSFAYQPMQDRDAFVAGHPYQTDYIQGSSGTIRVGPFDIDKYLKDSTVSIGKIEMDNVLFSDYRDNRPPFRSGIIKPLMVDKLKQIPFRLSIDSLVITRATTIYTELNSKTKELGMIPVTRMTVRMFPIRNFNLTNTDSLRIQANGYIMDSIWTRLRLRESYLDTLSGFLFTLRMKPVDMRVLNPALVPLASMHLRSGMLDTLSMRVAGTEYFAYGEMEMRYHDLKVQLLNNANKKSGFITGIMNFLANSIIKNKNTARTGNIFFLRNRDRSALNYLIKITMSGVGSSTGAKSNRKMLRKYKKELRQRNLPPLDYD